MLFTDILKRNREKAINVIESEEISYVYDNLISKGKINDDTFNDYKFVMDLSVFRQLITSIFIVDIFLRYKEKVKIKLKDIVKNKDLYLKYKALCDFEDYGTKTCMTYPVYLVSAVFYEETDHIGAIKRAKEYFESNNIKDCYSHPYDEGMFDCFYEIICSIK